MDINGILNLDEAKRYAVLGDQSPAWALLPTIDRLYVELRRLENKVYNENCSCHPNAPIA